MTELTKTIKKAMSGDFDTQFELIYAFAELGYNITIKKFEEEKKMLNFDKYREEVEKRAAWAVREGSKNPKPAHLVLNEIIIGKGLPYMKGKELVDWLFEEYEPPLLENGDDLNPGEWIMVRNDNEESWTSQVFLCFVYGYFVCVCDKEDIGHAGNYKLWKQARLPEGDELRTSPTAGGW